MNRLPTLCALIVSVALIGCSSLTGGGITKHVVVFPIHANTSTQRTDDLTRSIAALADKLEGAIGFERGMFDFTLDGASAGDDSGSTHCFLIRFDSAASRDAYLAGGTHAEFVASRRPHLDAPRSMDLMMAR